MEAKVDKQTQQTQAEVESFRQKLVTATGRKRQELQSHVAEAQSELELAEARREAMHSMAEFESGTSSNGLGLTGLRAQIQALADSLPTVLTVPANSGEATLSSSSKEQTNPALIAAVNQPAPSGIWGLTADLLALSQKIRTVDTAIQQTNALEKNTTEIRAPLLGRLRELSNRGDELAKAADSANQSELVQQGQQFGKLAAQFKQISAAALPLSKQTILLQLFQRNLTNWEGAIRSRRTAELKGLLVRLTFLGLILAIVFVAAELWRRTVYRYVRDPRRRYQSLLLRKFVLWFLVAVIIAFAFVSRLGSVVTFAGLITAGIVVALQSVILSMVGYFLLIGKFGIRVGDRVQIGGVTGEVVDVGLVRLHLMELSGSDYTPTGRVVAFANTIVFQPTAGLFKQIPGTNFLWHEITLRLSPDTGYDSLKERLLGVVEAILSDYREEMDRQNRAIERSLISISAHRFRPKAQVRFASSALEVIIRFPVDLRQAAEIDERVTRELLRELDREPKLKLATSAGPGMMLRTDSASDAMAA
jgi:small-conductance mechanosensitive channel